MSAAAFASASRGSSASREEVRESDDQKIRTIDARLQDYKGVIQDELAAAKSDYGVFIIDDCTSSIRRISLT